MVVAEVVGQQGHAALLHSRLVDAPDVNAHPGVGLGGNGELGLAHHHRAVLPEAHGVIVGGPGEQLAVGNQKAQRKAGRDVVKVAVDGAYHPVSQTLVILGGGSGGKAVADGGAESRHRTHTASSAVRDCRGGVFVPSVQQPAGDIAVRGGGVRFRYGFRFKGRPARGIGNVILMPRLVVGPAPENIVAQDNAVLEFGLLQPDLAAVGG